MPGRLHVDEEVADASMLRRIGVGAGDEDAHIGVLRAGSPDLLAVHHIVVAIADGAGLEGSEVGAGAGFAEELAPGMLPGNDLREVVRLLLFGAVDHHRGAGPAVADAAGARGAPPGELLAEDELFLHAEAAAAVFFRPGGRAPAALVELGCPIAHELAEARLCAAGTIEETPFGRAFCEFCRVLLIEEFRNGLAEFDFVGAIAKLHGSPPRRVRIVEFATRIVYGYESRSAYGAMRFQKTTVAHSSPPGSRAYPGMVPQRSQPRRV